MYQCSHTYPKSKPSCFKIHSASNTGHRWGTVLVKRASCHEELLMNRMLPSLVDDGHSFPWPLSALSDCIIQQVTWPGDRAVISTLPMSKTHSISGLPSTRLATCTCHPHFPARVKSSRRAQWCYEWYLSWISGYSHRSHPPQVKCHHHLKPWGGLHPLTFSLSQWLSQARVIPFYSFFWEASFPQVT